jgi:hypothetical protein
MSSRWRERTSHALGFRLALWYAVLFVASSLAVVSLTYVLLASSLRQRDHEIIRSTLEKYAVEYQRGGLDGLQGAIQSDRVAGRHEPLFASWRAMLKPSSSACRRTGASSTSIT